MWSPADVSHWVATALDLPQYADAFALHEVDGPTLLELTDETLQNPLGIVEPLKRKKILGHVKLLKIRNDVPGEDVRVTQLSQNSRRSPRSDSGSAGTPRLRSGGGRIVSAGQVQRVRRDRSVGSVGNKTPRSVSASSERSYDCGVVETSLYSDYTNPARRVTSGLTSNFGVDSPSFSRSGSFPQASGRKQVFPGVPVHQTPGPVHYRITRDTVDKVLTVSPKATIGRSPRNTLDYVSPPTPSPGVGKYDPPALGTKGHTFGGSSRWASGNQTKNWLIPRSTPGPSDYRPTRTYDSTFHV
jgi:hypothetical protein